MRLCKSFQIWSIYNSFTEATLARIQLYPHVIELTSPGSLHDVSPFSFPYGNISFGEKTFECGKYDEDPIPEESEDLPALEKLAGLEGTCFETTKVGSRDEFWRFCIANGVSEFFDSRGTRSPPREIAVSKALESRATHSWGFSERFEGVGGKFQAEYLCGDEFKQPQLSREVGGSEYRVRVSSFLFCETLADSIIGEIISWMPPLSGVSENQLWRYEYHRGSGLKQVPLNKAGQSMTNETIQLSGSVSESPFLNINRKEDKSLDQEDVFVRTVIETALPEGDLCVIHGFNRTVAVTFQCPHDWEDVNLGNSPGWIDHTIPPSLGIGKVFKARMFAVEEPDVCVYEMTVESTALCVDRSLIPRIFEVPNYAVSCRLINQ